MFYIRGNRHGAESSHADEFETHPGYTNRSACEAGGSRPVMWLR